MWGTNTGQGRSATRPSLVVAAIATAAIVFSALGVLGAPPADATADRPTSANGRLETISTNANAGADPSIDFSVSEGVNRPHGVLRYQTITGLRYVGLVDCFVQIDENTIAVGGPIVSTNVESWETQSWIAWIHDGGDASNDWIRPTVGPNTCDGHPWTVAGEVYITEQWQLTSGDIAFRG